MKKHAMLMVVCVLPFYVNAQNLVPNWSFEDTVNCPFTISQIHLATYWTAFGQSPDYLNPCNNVDAGVPTNFFGNQNAKSGESYAGLYTHAYIGMQLREFAGAQLFQPLDSGIKYYVSFNVSRAYKVAPTVKISKAINKLGVRFSTVPYSSFNPAPINNFAHVYSDSIILDTINWTKISGSFFADSAYEYISFGNFFTDSATSFIQNDTTGPFAYYYWDDFCVSTDSTYCANLSGIDKFSYYDLVRVFPNPTTNYIEIEGKKIIEINLLNILGNLCLSESINSSDQLRLNLSHLPKGVYFLKIQTKGNAFNKKIIIQ